jgi:hypothetical protein
VNRLEAIEFLKDLANRVMHIPVIHGTNGYDVDRLNRLAKQLEDDQWNWENRDN